jgi:hypothetical protein
MLLLLCCLTIILHLLGLPWWCSLLCIAFISFVRPARPLGSFIRGFLSVFIPWAILCSWLSFQNNNILAARAAPLFFMPGWPLLILATALLGGLIGGVTGLWAWSVNKWIKQLND